MTICAMLCCAMLCYAVLCCAMLCYAMLCYAMRCSALRCAALLWCARAYTVTLCHTAQNRFTRNPEAEATPGLGPAEATAAMAALLALNTGELHRLCAEAGLPQTGTKAVLSTRLLSAAWPPSRPRAGPRAGPQAWPSGSSATGQAQRPAAGRATAMELEPLQYLSLSLSLSLSQHMYIHYIHIYIYIYIYIHLKYIHTHTPVCMRKLS